MNLDNTKIILASKSPRRLALMTLAGFDFEVITSDIEEIITKEKPDEVVKELSSQKAFDVFHKLINSVNNNCNDDVSLMVIGADTVVSVNNTILGKPTDKNDAYRMIKKIQNNTHQVYTGVTVCSYNFLKKESLTKSFAECTEVTVYPMEDSEIYRYIATGDCYDKAGSYGIQGLFAVHVKEIKGDYNNVVGLPIARLYHEIYNNR